MGTGNEGSWEPAGLVVAVVCSSSSCEDYKEGKRGLTLKGRRGEEEGGPWGDGGGGRGGLRVELSRHR